MSGNVRTDLQVLEVKNEHGGEGERCYGGGGAIDGSTYLGLSMYKCLHTCRYDMGIQYIGAWRKRRSKKERR